MKEFTDKVAVVTGSGGGIGRALVERFTAEGMKAVVADVDPKLVDSTTANLQEQGRDVIGVVTDVTDLASLEEMRDTTLGAYGSVDVLCNNAGISPGADGQAWEHHVNDWKWGYDVNVQGVVNGLHVFLPTMLAQDSEGAVVATTSGNGGFTPIIQTAIYASTKAAVACIMECVWGQLRLMDSKITAHLLYPSTRTPGVLNTGIWRPGWHRPDRYDRPDAPSADAGRDGIAALRERMAAAGLEVSFAPLSEVADMCFEGIRDDVFWMSQAPDRGPTPGSAQQSLVRAHSQIDQSPPAYLIDSLSAFVEKTPTDRSEADK
jgi:NADP-dependent 3-hydroxy acid dehydrogenase YdfG